MNTIKKIFFINFYFFSIFSIAQQSKIDSLNSLLKVTKEDTIKIVLINELSKKYLQIGELDTAILYAEQALQYAEKIEYIKGVASAYLNKGNAFNYQGQYLYALTFYNDALGIYKTKSNLKGMATAYQGIGNVNYYLGNFSAAIKYYFLALKIKEKQKDSYSMALIYSNIASVYEAQKNKSKALKYFTLAIKLVENTNNKWILSGLYNNIGTVHLSENNYDLAYENIDRSLKLSEEISDKQGIANAYINIGSLYSQQGNNTNNLERVGLFNKAIEYQLKGISIYEEMGDKHGLAVSYHNIGIICQKMKKLTDANNWYKKSLDIANDTRDSEVIMENFHRISQVDSAMSNYESAYENYKIFVIYRDSIFNDENTKKLVQEQMNYEFEKKEAISKAEHHKQQAISQEQIKKQKIVIYSSVAGGVLLLALLSLAGYAYRQKQRVNKTLADKNSLIEEQKKHIEEKHKETTDSINYAKRLQEAILPPTELIHKYFPDSFVLYKPKDIVAGDFYWMENIDNITFIAAADCTGHGVPGAMVSVVCSNALNRAVKEFGLRDTGKILDKVTDLVLETFEKSTSDVKDGMDISLLSYNTTTKQIQWSGANNPLWYIENGILKEIKADKQPIGKHDNRKLFTTHTITSSATETGKSTFYLLTDGFADQFGGTKGKKFTYKRLDEAITSISILPLSEQYLRLNETFEDWKGTIEQLDDVTLIGIKLPPI